MKVENGNITDLFSAESFQLYVILTICLFKNLTHMRTHKRNLNFSLLIRSLPPSLIRGKNYTFNSIYFIDRKN